MSIDVGASIGPYSTADGAEQGLSYDAGAAGSGGGHPPHSHGGNDWFDWDRSDLVKTSFAAAVSAAALTIMIVISLTLVSIASANAQSWLSPISRTGYYPSWMAGPLGPLTSWFHPSNGSLETLFTIGVATMYVAYIAVLVCAPRMRSGWALSAVVALQLIFFLSPPLPLTDVFNYLNYGRMEMIHGLNPYTTIPALEPHSDPTFLLSNWHGLLSPYGPLFTLFTLAIVGLGVAGSFWAIKITLLVLSLAIIWLMWSCAGLLGRNRLSAALFVGLNPIVLVWGLGADHNDFFMVFAVMLAVYLLLRVRNMRQRLGEPLRAGAGPALEAGPASAVRARLLRAVAWIDGAPRPLPIGEPGWWWEFGAGLALAGAVAVKASAAILIPVVLAGSARRIRLSAGLLVGFIAVAVATLTAFGANLPNLGQQDALVIPTGIPNLIGYAVGFGGDAGGVRTIFTLILIAAVIGCSVWAWRTREWLLPCACVTLVLLVTLSWTLPWYLIWLLPFAGLAKGRRIRIAVLVVGAYLFLSWMPYSASFERTLGLHPETTNVGRSNERFLHSLLY